MMKFQYFSDIHLEHYHDNVGKVKRVFNIKSVDADVLLCAGDIGKPSHKSYKSFLSDMSVIFHKVLVVAGNHEYYGMSMSMESVDELCREVTRQMPQNNVHFLQNEEIHLSEDLSVFGGTFWTHIPRSKYVYVTGMVNDYRCINAFTPDVSNQLHENAVSALQTCIDNTPPEHKWVVMSHHMPSLDLIAEQYRRQPYTDMNYAFASNIDIADVEKIKAWVYGHTHISHQHGKFYCNPVGYKNENKHWDLNKTFTIS